MPGIACSTAPIRISAGGDPVECPFRSAPTRLGEQVDHLYPAYDFPFAYARQLDPLTQRDARLLDRCTATETCPRICHVATVLEIWEGRQSLGLTDPLGLRDVADPANVRTYIVAGTQHGPEFWPLATKPPFGYCQQQPNPNPYIWTMRALLRDLSAWVRDGKVPPQSEVPRIADGTLVAPDRVRFPQIPANNYGGTERPATSPMRVYDTLHVLDFGPLYRAGDSSGILTVEPPRVGTASYAVPVPIDTYTGWNLRRKDWFENGMCSLQGSFIPFAATRAERLEAGDRRPSLEERYPTIDVYVEAFQAAAERLVSQRLTLSEDASMLIGQATRVGVRRAP